MSTHTYPVQTGLTKARKAMIYVVVMVLVALVLVPLIVKLMADNDARNAVAKSQRAAFATRTHQSMDAMAATSPLKAQVMFETWNGFGTANPAAPAVAKVAFEGNLYRVCEFSDKYGMLCPDQLPAPAAIED